MNLSLGSVLSAEETVQNTVPFMLFGGAIATNTARPDPQPAPTTKRNKLKEAAAVTRLDRSDLPAVAGRRPDLGIITPFHPGPFAKTLSEPRPKGSGKAAVRSVWCHP